MKNAFWSAIETSHEISFVPAVWRQRLGEAYPVFRAAFLRKTAEHALYYPCPRQCGCTHRVVHDSPTELAAVCECERWNCDDLALSLDDVDFWELDRRALARAVSKALGLEFRFADLRLGNSFQIGLWSADFVPVILATEAEPKRFRWIVAELAARLRGAFILLAPTSGCLDAVTQEILAHARAGFFDLQSHLALGPQGELYPDQAPGQLFAAFTPQPKEPLDEDVARRAFALVQQFDAPTLAVFKFYCLEGLSGSQVARRCHCSKATVMARLKTIRRKTGMHPLQLRRLSPQVGKLEEQMSDSRARRLYRRRFIDDDSSDGRDDV